MGVLSDSLSSVDFSSFISTLQSGGWYQYAFPFLLVYTIVFTILEKVELFKDKKPVRVIIALIFAFFAVAFPISENGATLGMLLMSLFPGVSAFSMGILGLYVIIAMLGIDLTKFFGKESNKNKILLNILGALGAFVVVYYYGIGFGWWGTGSYGPLDWLIGTDGILRDPMLYILVLIGWLFYWISSDDGKTKKASSEE
jgi:hypothetical protein